VVLAIAVKLDHFLECLLRASVFIHIHTILGYGPWYLGIILSAKLSTSLISLLLAVLEKYLHVDFGSLLKIIAPTVPSTEVDKSPFGLLADRDLGWHCMVFYLTLVDQDSLCYLEVLRLTFHASDHLLVRHDVVGSSSMSCACPGPAELPGR